MKQRIFLVLLSLCFLTAVGCASNPGLKPFVPQGPIQLTDEEIKNADTSFLDDPTPVKSAEELAAEAELERQLQAQLTGQTGTEETVQPPETDGQTDPTDKNDPAPKVIYQADESVKKELIALRKELGGVASLADRNRRAINSQTAYTRENRDRIGVLQQGFEEEFPKKANGLLTGYRVGQLKLDPKQEKYLYTKYVLPKKQGKKVRVYGITGFVDEAPVKNGKLTLDDFSGHRAVHAKKYLEANGIVPESFQIVEGGVTDQFGNQRSVYIHADVE